jgi:hypothetical protein
MLKKSLLFFGIVILLGTLVIGCPNATGSSGGKIGGGGGGGTTGSDAGNYGTLSGIVTREILEKAFKEFPVLMIQDGTIEGLIPSGKTLVVQPGTTTVGAMGWLTVQGTLEIQEGAVLDACYTAQIGYLRKTEPGRAAIPGGGKLLGAGNISLPFLRNNDAKLPEEVISYNDLLSIGGVKPSIGSLVGTDISAGGNATVITMNDIGSTFKIPGIDNLTLSNMRMIDIYDVPDGKTLTLTGPGNTVVSNLNLSIDKGSLVIARGAVLTVDTGLTITGSEKTNIKVEGRLKLANGAARLSILGEVDLSKATIDASGAGAATLVLPAGNAEIEKIIIGAQDLLIRGPTSLRVTDIKSGNTEKGIKSGSIKKYYLSETDFVGLGSAQDTFIITDITGNMVSIATPEVVVIGSALTIAGDVKFRTVGGPGISITGANNGFLPLTTENLAKFVDSKITFSDAVTGIAETLVIPRGITVKADEASLDAITGLLINGRLAVRKATMAGITNQAQLIGNGTLECGAFSEERTMFLINSRIPTLYIASDTVKGNFTINKDEYRAFSENVTLTGNIEVNGGVCMFYKGSTIHGNIAVKDGRFIIKGNTTAQGTITVSGVNALSIHAPGVLTIANNKSLQLFTAASVDQGSFTGSIKATDGSIRIGDTSYTTTANGVKVENFDSIIAAIAADTAKLKNGSSNLADFGGTNITGIGTVSPGAATAANVKKGGNTNIVLSTGTAFVDAPALNASGFSGTNSNDIKAATFKLSLGGAGKNEVSVTDSGPFGTAEKKAILTYTGVQLQNSGLISPALPPFTIGITTKR